MKYYYISLKWTHKTDAFITFWGPNHCGYQWSKEMIGEYDLPHVDNEHVKTVDKEVADVLFSDHKNGSDGIICAVLNTPKNRKRLGITKNMLIRQYPSHCPRVSAFTI